MPKNGENRPDYATMPVRQRDGRDLQVFISDYTLTTIVRSVISKNFMSVEKYMTGDEIATIIEDFSDFFGDHEWVKVMLKATPLEHLDTDKLPTVTVSRDESKFNFYGDIQVMNPFDESVPTLTLQYRFEAYLNFRIDENFKLFIEDDSIDTTFTTLIPYFRTRTRL